MFIISSASVEDGKLEVHSVIRVDYEGKHSLQDAINIAKKNIAEDFGYESWTDYNVKRNPIIIEIGHPDSHYYQYTIYDDNCGHQEMYRVEEV